MDIVIGGAGIAGLTAGIALVKEGHNVKIYDEKVAVETVRYSFEFGLLLVD